MSGAIVSTTMNASVHHAQRVSADDLFMTAPNYYAFDIDGVLADTRRLHQAALEAKLGVTLQGGNDYDHFGFWHDDAAVRASLKAMALDVWQEVAADADVMPGALEAVRGLGRRFMGYVTRRDRSMFDLTYAWLQNNGFPASTLHLGFVDGFQWVKGQPCRPDEKPAPCCKSDYVRYWLEGWKYGPSFEQCVLVEDSPHEAIRAAQSGLRVMVLRRGDYNRDFEATILERQEEANVHGLPSRAHLISFISSLGELP